MCVMSTIAYVIQPFTSKTKHPKLRSNTSCTGRCSLPTSTRIYLAHIHPPSSSICSPAESAAGTAHQKYQRAHERPPRVGRSPPRRSPPPTTAAPSEPPAYVIPFPPAGCCRCRRPRRSGRYGPVRRWPCPEYARGPWRAT